MYFTNTRQNLCDNNWWTANCSPQPPGQPWWRRGLAALPVEEGSPRKVRPLATTVGALPLPALIMGRSSPKVLPYSISFPSTASSSPPHTLSKNWHNTGVITWTAGALRPGLGRQERTWTAAAAAAGGHHRRPSHTHSSSSSGPARSRPHLTPARRKDPPHKGSTLQGTILSRARLGTAADVQVVT